MGKFFLDQYSYLHFASGIISYFWNINFKYWIFLHSIFEIIENTNLGIKFINNKMLFWPGGKPHKDSYENIAGDTLSAILGWLSAYLIDNLGNHFRLYEKHI